MTPDDRKKANEFPPAAERVPLGPATAEDAAIYKGIADNYHKAGQEERTERAERERDALRAALRKLVDECEAEFTTDGYWNADGALVRRKTVQAARAVLAVGETK